jgi:hypothetical protein
VKPSVNAGPDTTADWGRVVQLNGKATDPGSNDQATLQFTWRSATARRAQRAARTSRTRTPGDYTATLQVCDKDLECDTGSMIVQVTERDTTLGATFAGGDAKYDASADTGLTFVIGNN